MKRHPGREGLLAWLAGAQPDLGGHIEKCERCMQDLEDLTSFDPLLEDALRAVTRPERGFLVRLEARLEERRRNRDTWAAVIDLFSLGWRMFDTLTQRDDNEDD